MWTEWHERNKWTFFWPSTRQLENLCGSEESHQNFIWHKEISHLINVLLHIERTFARTTHIQCIESVMSVKCFPKHAHNAAPGRLTHNARITYNVACVYTLPFSTKLSVEPRVSRFPSTLQHRHQATELTIGTYYLQLPHRKRSNQKKILDGMHIGMDKSSCQRPGS
jgi:hypothetical protein